MKIFKILIFLFAIMFKQCFCDVAGNILTINNRDTRPFSIGLYKWKASEPNYGHGEYLNLDIRRSSVSTYDLGTFSEQGSAGRVDIPWCAKNIILRDEFGNKWKEYPFMLCGNIIINITCTAPGGCENINLRQVKINGNIW